MTNEEYERFLRERIADLHREYAAAVRPYVETLVKLEAAKPPPPIIIDPAVVATLEGTRRFQELIGRARVEPLPPLTEPPAAS